MRRLAPPFLTTFAALACTHNEPTMTHNPPMPQPTATASAPASADPPPAASSAEPMWKDDAGCHRPPEGAVVACPPSGPTLVLPASMQKDDGPSHIGLDKNSLTCTQYFTVQCPPGTFCNPPPPHHVPCPPELLPQLANGVQPTANEGGKCKLGDVNVACPK